MEQTKTNLLYSIFATLIIVVCGVMFSACGGGTLSSEATYDENVSYSESATTSDTNASIDAIMGKITKNSGGRCHKFRCFGCF